MADITDIFKSTVKMLRVRHKDLTAIKSQSGLGSGDDRQKDQTGNSKPAHSKSKNSNMYTGEENMETFSEKTRVILGNISGLKSFLLKNRKAYMAASSNIPRSRNIVKLSEEERDRIDIDAMNYIKLCNETLTRYKSEVLHKHLSAQQREHRTLVIYMVEEFLKVVCQMYAEQKAIRVKRAIDRQNMRKLELSLSSAGKSGAADSNNESHTNFSEHNNRSTQNLSTSIFGEFETDSSQPEVTSEEAQMFKVENEQLYNEMNSTLEEVRQIEGKVVEISRLQDIFTEKVLEQDADISRIGDAMVHSTENIVQGNDDIREAMKNNAGMRVWIVFGICVLAFTLLFLDWYND